MSFLENKKKNGGWKFEKEICELLVENLMEEIVENLRGGFLISKNSFRLSLISNFWGMRRNQGEMVVFQKIRVLPQKFTSF